MAHQLMVSIAFAKSGTSVGHAQRLIFLLVSLTQATEDAL